MKKAREKHFIFSAADLSIRFTSHYFITTTYHHGSSHSLAIGDDCYQQILATNWSAIPNVVPAAPFIPSFSAVHFAHLNKQIKGHRRLHSHQGFISRSLHQDHCSGFISVKEGRRVSHPRHCGISAHWSQRLRISCGCSRRPLLQYRTHL
jgi:hypothetical protein